MATRFEQARAGSPAEACELLAPATRDKLEQQEGRPCAAALREAGLGAAGTVSGAQVAGHSAQVTLERDTVFLALFDDGWRVTAAGCSAGGSDPQEPYECAVEGR